MTSDPQPHLPEDHRRVRDALRHCQGRDQAVTNAQLAAITGIPVRRLRKIIAELIEQFGAPIGSRYSHDGGHYWIASDEERRETVAVLRAHASAILGRMARLDRVAARETAAQLALELA